MLRYPKEGSPRCVTVASCRHQLEKSKTAVTRVERAQATRHHVRVRQASRQQGMISSLAKLIQVIGPSSQSWESNTRVDAGWVHGIHPVLRPCNGLPENATARNRGLTRHGMVTRGSGVYKSDKSQTDSCCEGGRAGRRAGAHPQRALALARFEARTGPRGAPPGGLGRRYPEGSVTAAKAPVLPAARASTSRRAAARGATIGSRAGVYLSLCRLHSTAGLR